MSWKQTLKSQMQNEKLLQQVLEKRLQPASLQAKNQLQIKNKIFFSRSLQCVGEMQGRHSAK